MEEKPLLGYLDYLSTTAEHRQAWLEYSSTYITVSSGEMSFLQSLSNTYRTTKTTRSFRRNHHGENAAVAPIGTPTAASGPDNGMVGTSHKDIRHYAEAILGSSSLAAAVKKPEGEDELEWQALHVVTFYNHINMLYSSITEFCSPTTCPRMIATAEYEYLWQEANSKPVSLSAPEYFEHLMNWVQDLIDDENVFPQKSGVPFPYTFPTLAKTIMKRMFRIYAHIYCHHFDQITALGLQKDLNTSLKHFVLFCNEFNMIAQSDYGPLQDLIHVLLQDS